MDQYKHHPHLTQLRNPRLQEAKVTWTDWNLGPLHCTAHAHDAVNTGRLGRGWGPEIHLLDDILLMGSRGPDCGIHSPSAVTSSRTSALTVEFWRFPVRGKSSSSIWAGKPAKLGLRSRPEEVGWPPHPTRLTSAGGQAADLDRVRLVPLTLPQTAGVGPAHHLPQLDALSASDGALPWGDRGGGCGETEEGGGELRSPASAQDRKGTEKGAKSLLDQRDMQGLLSTASQDSTATVKYSCTRWERATALILESPEPSHHLEGACGTPFRHYCLCPLCLACAWVLKYFVYHPAAIH